MRGGEKEQQGVALPRRRDVNSPLVYRRAAGSLRDPDNKNNKNFTNKNKTNKNKDNANTSKN